VLNYPVEDERTLGVRMQVAVSADGSTVLADFRIFTELASPASSDGIYQHARSEARASTAEARSVS
jgi:hypothetical protein